MDYIECLETYREAGIYPEHVILSQCERYRNVGDEDEDKARASVRAKEISVKELLVILVVLKLSKTAKGLEVIKVLGKEFIKGTFDTLHSLGQASAANKVSSWANPHLVAAVLDRFGFVKPGFYDGFTIGLSTITGATVAEGFIDTIQGFFPFSKPEPSEYPSDITFSARTEAPEVVEALREAERTK